MRLTRPIPLDPNNAAIDAYDLARCTTSILDPTPLVKLRWGAVREDDMLKYLTAVYSSQITADACIPRISTAKTDDKGNELERREHLVIRDLELVPYLLKENPYDFGENSEVWKLGRIVAHADYRFRPKGWSGRRSQHPYKLRSDKQPKISKPDGAKVELIEMFDEQVEELLDYHCKDESCFELVNISTNATHLRQGLAKQLVGWLFPFCDEHQLDYRLIASPMGRGLYRNCGFVEEGVGDKWAVEIDMEDWGGSGVHQHVYMVRHPVKESI